MDKKPLCIFSTDWHLKSDNLDQIIDLITQKCELAKKLKVNKLVCLGDVFESRISQRQEVLKSFGEISDIIQSYGLELVLIPGNHDKTLYSSEDSFLLPYKSDPKLLLINKMGGVPFHEHGVMLHFIPFFEDDIWINYFNDLLHYIDGDYSVKRILCSHIAVNGSINNDGSEIESTIKPSLFKNFHKVFLGHYHNTQQVSKNIFHLPSIQQNNFGEDNQKGFTVLYSDGSHELIKSNFVEYKKIQLDLTNSNTNQVNEIVKGKSNSPINLRVELLGTESEIKAFDKNFLISNGIDVKSKVKEIEDNIVFTSGEEVKQYNKTSIIEEFKECCSLNDWDVTEGMVYLKEKLNG